MLNKFSTKATAGAMIVAAVLGLANAAFADAVDTAITAQGTTIAGWASTAVTAAVAVLAVSLGIRGVVKLGKRLVGAL